VKNDALINLADNLKTKGLLRAAAPHLHPYRAVESDKNSRREIANQRRVGGFRGEGVDGGGG